MTWAQNLIHFYRNLEPLPQLPEGVSWLYPQQSEEVMKVVEAFCYKYFSDNRKRTLFLGINPGRFGAGVTGVNFTAPRQLTTYCGIKHPFRDQSELSAEFIYDMINAYGGVDAFYKDHFIGSVCTLGFVRGGKNLNYYDDKELLQSVEPFIIRCIEEMISFGVNNKLCLCIGGEKNYRYLSQLNGKHGWFRHIEPLPHPRFIMQYRRPTKEQFIRQYLQLIKK